NADVQIASDIDLSGLGGGSGGTGGGADTNPTNNDLPVKFQNDLAQNVFVNSIVNEIGTFTTPTTVAAMTVNDVTSGMMLTIDNVGVGLSGADQSAAQTAFNTRFGTATPNTTIIVGGTEYTGTLTATLLGAGATFELASGTFSGADEVSDNTAVTLPLVAGARTVTGIQIDGNLEVLGTQTQVDSVTVTLADQFIQLGTPDGSGALAARDSGFLNVVSRSAGDVLNLQGIRYDASTNAWQVSSNTTGVSVDGSGIPDTDSDWATIQTVGGSHGIAKLSATFGASASATAPSVATVSLNGATVASFTNTVVSRVGTDAATNDKYININLGSSDTGGGFSVSDLFGHSVVQVQIFESGSQIIAEEVILGQVRSTTGALSSAANQLTITLPRTAVLGALTVIVIG
ncbi:MAG: hypothetical protein MPJ25_15300, partial [Pirellulales bacterium]|nr:hypothetical protein [Pirellulales bacterium]